MQAATPALPGRTQASWRACKRAVHVLRRTVLNTLPGAPRRLVPGAVLARAPAIAESRSPLWTGTDGRDAEFVLVAGKVENLRLACRAFDGVHVPAGAVLSFWAQLGWPSRWRGFVPGREVISGCVVPTIAGGLCQLSNALAECAAQAGALAREQHGHSARPQGSTAQPQADATVAWNHVDLRLQAEFDFRIEVRLTSDELIVRWRACQPARPSHAVPAARSPNRPLPLPLRLKATAAVPEARGCLSCNETACFRHGRLRPAPGGRQAVLVDGAQPETARWLAVHAPGADWFVPWSRRAAEQGWPPPGVAAQTAYVAAVRRSLALRARGAQGGARQSAVMNGAAALALSHARHLRPWHTQLVLAQEFLVPLWRAGVLAGRQFDVFVSQLPASEIQRRLDAAASARPGVYSLVDFRVDDAWQHDEWQALAAARRRLSPHAEIQRQLRIAGLTVDALPWELPAAVVQAPRSPSATPTLAFPASALPRKGVFELAEVARRLSARVLVLGTPSSESGLWHGVQVDHLDHRAPWWLQADVAVLPALIEHAPRGLLRALACGIPVVASTACGLTGLPGVQEVETGDADALHRATAQALARSLSLSQAPEHLRAATAAVP